MQLSKHPEQAFAVKRIVEGKLEINGVLQDAPYALSIDGLHEIDQSISPTSLSVADAHKLMQLGNKVFLLATGEKTVFPGAQTRAAFLSQGIGLEVMDTRAAAYTYNVLIQENRDVCLVVLG